MTMTNMMTNAMELLRQFYNSESQKEANNALISIEAALAAYDAKEAQP